MSSARHLVDETNPIPAGYWDDRDGEIAMNLKDFAAAGGRVTRVRWLTERVPGVGTLSDLSYVHGRLPDSTPVRLNDPGLYGVEPWKQARSLVEWAQREGVYAKGVGLLDRAVWSVLA